MAEKKKHKELKEEKKEKKMEEKNEGEAKNDEKAGEENLEIKISKEIWIVIGIIAMTIIAIAAIVYISKGAGKFEYNGIQFQKEYTGEILFYAAKIPVYDVYGNQVSMNSIDFRNDPRDLGEINVETYGNIAFIRDKTVYVAYSDLRHCDYNGVAAVNLGRFLGNAGLSVKGAVMNDSGNSSDVPYVTCSLYPENTVIEVKNGDSTEIRQTSENCYEIVSKDCEILKAAEKFQLVILEQYMEEIGRL